MTYALRYRADTPLADRFSTITLRPWKTPGYPSREVAERVRAACPNGADMEVIEIEGDR